MLNPELVKMAHHGIRRNGEKRGFVPSDAAAGGGAPPGGGGAPPPGGGGGAPPPDPSMGGGGPPPGGGGGGLSAGVDPMAGIATTVTQAVQQAMATSGGAGGAGGAGAMGKPAKPDINTVAMDCFQVKKILMHICKTNGWELPPDILDGPNRDPSTGAAMPMGAPGSTSDPNMAQGGDAGGGAQPQSAIQPIQPMEGAFPSAPGGGGGGEKSGSVRVGEEFSGGPLVQSRAAAVAALFRSGRRPS